jgi:hypothetical protein
MRLSSPVVCVFGSMLLCAVIAGCRYHPTHLAFIDRAGRVRIRLGLGQEAKPFSGGLAAVSLHGRWGYIDQDGKWVIPPQFGEGGEYEAAGEFSEGLAPVMNGGYFSKSARFGFIDRTGRYVIAPKFDWAGSFSEGVAAVCTGPCRFPWLPERPSYGYINKAGDYVIGPQSQWESVAPFSEGRAWVSEWSLLIGGKLVDYNQETTRLVDHDGRFVSDARFRWGTPFSDGLAATDRGYVNRQGDIVIAGPTPGVGGEFGEGWASATIGGKTVFIDTTGKIVLRPNCDGARPFSEGLAAAGKSNCNDGRCWGYIDKTGRFVIQPQFDYDLGPFHDGLAPVCFGCRDDY